MKSLQQPVTALTGVGPKTALALQSLNIQTVEDLLYYFPFRYDNIQARSLNELNDQEKVVLKGVIATPPVVTYFGPKKNRLTFQLTVDHVPIRVTFFNQSFLKNSLQQNMEVAIFGKWDEKRKQLSGMKVLGKKNENHDLSPIYHVNRQVKQASLVKWVQQAYDEYHHVIPELLPDAKVKEYGLMSRKEAIFEMHFPKNYHRYQQARQRMAYEELFLFELKMQLLKREEIGQLGDCHHYDVKALRQFIQTLPFELTQAQKKVTNDICRDLLAPKAMNRLLQGDVGSGKTVVAALALFAITTCHKQGALLVPTEILAEQHYAELQRLFTGTSLRVACLVGSMTPKEKRVILEQLQTGEIDIIVGTHALIQQEVTFASLGLAVIDEQHRFGVNQRKALRQKGERVDVLSMTATPIPRTLAITAYGDMDVSTIDELPKGRKPIQTSVVSHQQLSSVLDTLKQRLALGEQAYVICPLIEESEAIDAKNAEKVYEELCQYFAPMYRVGLLHGKMKAEEKETLMAAFVRNEVSVIVSTTVIEVGVNVPNATTMMIMNADRFGLAQLHQLRGRVGRGNQQSYCVLIADPKTEQGRERMDIMTTTTNGFVLSQKDLEMRGPGEFFGSRQSGLPEFKIANIIEDETILNYATRDAKQLAEHDFTKEDEYQPLVYYLKQHDQVID